MEFEKLANPNRLLPSHLIGKVVSSPLQCLPIVSAITVKNTTELSLGHKGIEELEGFGLFTNLETLWLNGNRLQRINGLDTNKRIKKKLARINNQVTIFVRKPIIQNIFQLVLTLKQTCMTMI